MRKKIIPLFLLFAAISCIYPKITIKGKGNVKLTQVDFENLDGWQSTDYRLSLLSFLNSCQKMAKMPQSRALGGQIGEVTAADFRDVCEIGQAVKGMSDLQIKNYFENWFKPFLVATKSGESNGLFTGYYEAQLRGSKIKNDIYKYPIYARPKDLTGSEPYLTRAQIENGALQNRDLEILYVDDKVDLFFMHIQGSGRVTLPSGAILRLSFAARNNQPFTAISNYLAENKYIERSKMSADSVKDWLRANPDKADEAMNINAAYIFFKISDLEYVVGAQGVALTPEHSLAVDSDIIPYGLPIWVETSIKKNGGKEKYSNLFIAQDTGSAIKGTVRGDIFFGHGKEAETKASSMATAGKYFIFLPNNVADKIAGSSRR